MSIYFRKTYISVDEQRTNCTFYHVNKDHIHYLSPKKTANIKKSSQNMCTIHCDNQSCGLYDIMSCFQLALQYCDGQGGLDNVNAVQFLHKLYSLFDSNFNSQINWIALLL